MTLPLRERVALEPRTTMGVGGPARYWITADREHTVVAALAWAQEKKVPVTPLGSGSNVIVADRGIEGLVLQVAIDRLDARPSKGSDEVLVDVGAGVQWDRLVGWAVQQGYAGIECLAGIPGLAGAAPIQNIGAYGQQVADCIQTVRVLDRTTGEAKEFSYEECQFDYRHSWFKGEAAERYIIVGLTLRLRSGGAPTVAYPELQQALTTAGQPSNLASVRQQVLALRAAKSMLVDEDDPNRRSVGSFFVNPIVPTAVADRIDAATDTQSSPEAVPRFPAPANYVKLPAAWLIERAGFPKGTTRDRVGLSPRHSLAIVNRGGASAADIVTFGAEIRAQVYGRFGVALEVEPQLLGFEPGELARLTGPLG